jgi:hypothetical protein
MTHVHRDFSSEHCRLLGRSQWSLPKFRRKRTNLHFHPHTKMRWWAPETPNTLAIRPAAAQATHTAATSSSPTTTGTNNNDANRVDATQGSQQSHEPTVRKTSTLPESIRSSATLVIRPRSFRSFAPVFPGRHFAPVSQGASLSSLRDPAADIDNTPVLGPIARPVSASSSATLIPGLQASSGTRVTNAATTTNTPTQLSQHCMAKEDAVMRLSSHGTAAVDAMKRLEENITVFSSRYMATKDAVRRLENNVAALSSHCMAANNVVGSLEDNVTALSHLVGTSRTYCEAHQNSAANTGETTQEVNDDLYENP